MEKKYKSLGEFYKDYKTEYGYLHHKGWVERICKDMGWKMTTPRNYWTKERCSEESKKYTSVEDWCREHKVSYRHAKTKGWFEELSYDMIKLIPSSDWTKELCLQEALKYDTRTKWCKGHNRSSKAAKINGWYEECTAHMQIKTQIGYWTKEKCHAEALKYTIKEHWKKGHNKSYSNARRHGWYDECTTHMIEGCKPRNYWSKEKCHIEALKFDIKERWKKGHPQSYQAAQRNGWVKELTQHMVELTKPNGYWTKERCIENAKKFTNITDWSTANSTPVTNARANGWYDECTAHMVRVNKPNGYWINKERCIEEAKKYKTVSDWAKYSSASYSQSKKNGWIYECTAHMVPQRIRLNSWTKELCHAEALKYKTRNEWQKNNSNSYRAAKSNGWFNEFTSHMIILKVKESYWTKEHCIENALKFKTKGEWKKNGFSSYNAAKKNGWLDECCKHMKNYGQKV